MATRSQIDAWRRDTTAMVKRKLGLALADHQKGDLKNEKVCESLFLWLDMLQAPLPRLPLNLPAAEAH